MLYQILLFLLGTHNHTYLLLVQNKSPTDIVWGIMFKMHYFKDQNATHLTTLTNHNNKLNIYSHSNFGKGNIV